MTEVPGDQADPARAAALDRVKAFLVDHGTTDEEIARAAEDDVLDLLVADRLLVPSRARYTVADVAGATGMPAELVGKFWRALGFADVGPDERAFTDLDIEAVFIFQAMVEIGAVEIDPAVQLARVIGSSMARIAEAEVSPAMPGLPGVLVGDSVFEADRFAQLASSSLPAMGRLIEFVWRRHVQAATRRAMLQRVRGSGSALPEITVGFADMVGFTMLSQHLSDEELAAVVSRFEELAHDTVLSLGGRVVKMIGDEAMFVSESVEAAARIGLSLAEAYADDDLLSDVRVAMAVGPVLVQDGDHFGPVVNLASRVVNIANPGSVLISDDFHRALMALDHPSSGAEGGEFACKAMRPRQLKDLGRVQLWTLARAGAEPASADRRTGRRWDRLSEVPQDIDELRIRGERAFVTGRLSGPAVRRVGLRGLVGGELDGGEPEGPELEASVHGGEGPAPEVHEPT